LKLQKCPTTLRKIFVHCQHQRQQLCLVVILAVCLHSAPSSSSMDPHPSLLQVGTVYNTATELKLACKAHAICHGSGVGRQPRGGNRWQGQGGNRWQPGPHWSRTGAWQGCMDHGEVEWCMAKPHGPRRGRRDLESESEWSRGDRGRSPGNIGDLGT